MGHAKDVWGHSSPEGVKHYTIFAINQDPIALGALRGWLTEQKINFKSLLGSYRGVMEHSFIVNSEHIMRIADAGWLKGQESVLALGVMDSQDRRAAKLIFLNADGWPADDGDGPDWAKGRAEVDLGRMVSVSRERAFAEDAWSYDPTQNEYFITIAQHILDA